jgi:hypothetical protein
MIQDWTGKFTAVGQVGTRNIVLEELLELGVLNRVPRPIARSKKLAEIGDK